MTLSEMNSKTFTDCLNSRFTCAETGVALELVGVTESTASPRMEQFSLIFRGPLSPVYPQRVYGLDHETIGKVELFMVPIGPDGQGMQYEAVFSRFRDR